MNSPLIINSFMINSYNYDVKWKIEVINWIIKIYEKFYYKNDQLSKN